MRGLLTSLVLVVAASLILPQSVCGYQTTFFFHNDRELSISSQIQIDSLQISIQASPSSSSARAYEESTTNAPSGAGTAITLTAQIYVPASSGQPPGYAAIAAWLTKPFQTKVRLDGDVDLHVWMSSSDDVGFFGGSLFFLGVADYSPASSKVEVLSTHVSDATLGNILGSSPKECSAPNGKMRINQHDFQIGDRLMFFAGAASTKQGWKFTVYFDSSSWNSRAEIPADPALTVPEFGNATILLTLSALMLSIFRKFGSNSVHRNLNS